MSACRVAQGQLVLRDELAEDEAASLRAHLELCSGCRRIEQVFHGLLAAVREVPMPAPDDPSWDRMVETIMARVRALPNSGRAIGLRAKSRLTA